MSRLSLFSSPLLLGFDQFERALDRVTKATADGYPPYNVEQVGEDALRLTLAVAGFKPDELSVQLEDNQLVIRGKQAEEADRVYLHRGIAARQFQRSFVLADGIEVTGAGLDNGLLNIDLRRRAAEGVVRAIEINAPVGNGTKPIGSKKEWNMNIVEKLDHISDQDFAMIGLQQLAYVKPTVVNGINGFAIHAADGTQIGMAPSRDIAFAAVKQHELEPVSLH